VKIFIIIFLYLSVLVFVPKVFAEGTTGCGNRYLTLVNPVRGRGLWFDQSLKPIQDQYLAISGRQFPASWLLQYDVLKDKDLIGEIKNFNRDQEIGVFLEVSSSFAKDARVVYPYNSAWSEPQAIFLSGYSQSERRRLIDKLFEEFKKEFNFYPKSIGAWWIDSYSLNYLKDKYHIKAAMIVADQKTTDNYGVWGQWWGVPYFPSKANILTPANNLNNKQDVVVIQWAQRDPILAYGSGPSFSNYSLQANDYIRQGKNIDYFTKLVNVYLDCQNPLGQITVGLEVGMESVGYSSEYKNQLEVLSTTKSLQPLTMSEFADKYSNVYPSFPRGINLGSGDSKWILTIDKRMNQKLGDSISYQPKISFSDYFLPDKTNFLDRKFSLGITQNSQDYKPWFVLISLILGIFAYRKKIIGLWFISSLFSFSAFGLIFRSSIQNGWQVFYGPVVPFLIFSQIVIVVASFFIFWSFSNLKIFSFLKNYLWIFPLVFGLDEFVLHFRTSFITNKYYFGFLLDSLRFIGITFSKPFQVGIVNQDFPGYISSALLKFNIEKIWGNLGLALVIYPLFHVLVGVFVGYFLYKFPLKFRVLVVSILVLFWLLFLIETFQSDPRIVIPIS
jgi:hypothetical protein